MISDPYINDGISIIRKKFITLFIVLALVNSIGAFFFLRKSLIDYQNQVKQGLLRDAHIVNDILESNLSDASRLLDVARVQILKLINQNELTDQAAHKILEDSKKVFSSYVTNDALLLTLYINKDGLVRATSKDVLKPPVDVNDRLHYSLLKNTPNKSMAIGELVTSRITELPTFHIAIPLIDSQGQFRGTLAAQILTGKIENSLDESLDGIAGAHVITHLDGGHIAFSYPRPLAGGGVDFNVGSYINGQINADSHSEGVISLPSSLRLPESLYVAFSKSSLYGFQTSVSVAMRMVFLSFLKINLFLLIYIGLAAVGSIWIMWRFYKSAVVTENALLMSFTDELTGIKNRRALDSEFSMFWKESLRTKNPISALFIDIDHFKIFNDTFGHDAGDEVLKALVAVLLKAVRRPLDICCRWGGEEFVVILPNTDELGATQKANEILEKVRNIPLIFGENHPQITVSIGISTLVAAQNCKANDLVSMADQAMYVAKHTGRDRCVKYRAGMSGKVQ